MENDTDLLSLLPNLAMERLFYLWWETLIGHCARIEYVLPKGNMDILQGT
jgi:hypothetical protein